MGALCTKYVVCKAMYIRIQEESRSPKLALGFSLGARPADSTACCQPSPDRAPTYVSRAQHPPGSMAPGQLGTWAAWARELHAEGGVVAPCSRPGLVREKHCGMGSCDLGRWKGLSAFSLFAGPACSHWGPALSRSCRDSISFCSRRCARDEPRRQVSWVGEVLHVLRHGGTVGFASTLSSSEICGSDFGYFLRLCGLQLGFCHLLEGLSCSQEGRLCPR